MSRLRLVIQRIEDETQPETVTELDRIDVPPLDARSLEKETALDHLETQTLTQGQAVMRHLLVRQWEGVEQQLVDSYRELFSPQPHEGRWPRPAEGGQPGGEPPASPTSPGARGRRGTRRARK